MEIRNAYNPTFTGYKSVFSKKLEKAMDSRTTSKSASRLLNDFADMYEKKVCLNRKIGSGFYGSVYKIDDCYVLKRGNENLEPEFGGIEVIKHPKFASLKRYFGEPVARIYNNYGEDMAIIKNVYSKGKSIPAGICDDFAKKHTLKECIDYYNNVYLPKFAKLPQRSFDGIAKDFKTLNDMGTKRKSYFFDFLNPNNFVLCGKTLRILDEINEDEYIVTKNCVSDMFDVFLNRIDLDISAEFDMKSVPLRKELTKKLILAGVRHEVPMCESKTDLTSWEKTFNNLLDFNFSEDELWNITRMIEKLTESIKNPQKRVDSVKQYLEHVVEL